MRANPYSSFGLTAKPKGDSIVFGYLDLRLTIKQANIFLDYLQHSKTETYFEHLKLIGQLRQKIDEARESVASHIEKELDKV